MAGFFTASEIEKTAKIEVDYKNAEPNCISCGRNRDCNSPILAVSGIGKKEILLIGDSPESLDDQFGIHWKGDSGHILNKYFGSNDISIKKDCWSIYAVNCYKPAKIEKNVIKYCRPLVRRTIAQLQPKYIITLGNRALASLLGEDFSKINIDRFRGLCIPDQELNAFVIPIHDPHQIHRSDKDRSLKKVYERDTEAIKLHLKKKFKKANDVSTKILLSFTDVIKALKLTLKKESAIYIDYETTGVKPFKKGHKIVSIAIAESATKAYAFPYDWKDHWTKKEIQEIRRIYIKILTNKNIRKMAHNIPFENMWSEYFFCKVNNWFWDTMNTAHILDNRSKFVKLKFQTYINFGIRPYDKSIRKFLESKDEGGFNTIEKAPLKDLLEYNGFDVLYGWRLYETQMNQIAGRKKLIKANSFFLEGSLVLSEMQLNGSCSNDKYYEKEFKKMGKTIKKLKKKLTTGREARKFKKVTGRNIDIGSPKDLGMLFYDILGAPAIYTEGSKDKADKDKNYSVDKEALAKVKLPFVDRLMELRKIEKAKNTYLAQFIRESDDGIIHGFFGLGIPVSYRSSAYNPNWQNIPKRDKIIKLLVRKGIIPRLNSRIVEIDFGGAEVITSASYHRDKNFINYLLDKSTDMHRDIAKDLWLFSDEEWDSLPEEAQDDIRFYAKNLWTFAQFYGDWFGSCAPNLWEISKEIKIGKKKTLRDWVESKGIRELGIIIESNITPGSFLEHCKEVERIMWEDRFGEYTQWKDDIEKEYQKNGFITTFLGFEYRGIMSRNQVTNYPIQGTSFHLLLYTLIQVNKEIKKRGLKTKLIAQIHDSIIADVPKNEFKEYTKMVTDIINNLHKKFKWLALPMTADVEYSKVREKGGNFGEMSKYKLAA